ncbi:MAG: hypothetical protein V7776_11470 [Halopseudomonas aestusnigri]
MIERKEGSNPFPVNTKNYHLPEGSLFGKIARGVGRAMTALVYSPKDLSIHVSNKIVQMDDVLERENTFFGRIYNKISGEDITSIALDGVVIQQLHDVVGVKTPFSIEIQYQYNIDHNELRDLYARAKTIIDENTPESKIKETLSPPSVKRRR